ncbi:hypothetical protein CBM2629_B20049 [Cupriavidus taiwanensis]|nr:hypothetical protein CBM2629_B20049 [Cupriavidus taiwanensis]
MQRTEHRRESSIQRSASPFGRGKTGAARHLPQPGPQPFGAARFHDPLIGPRRTAAHDGRRAMLDRAATCRLTLPGHRDMRCVRNHSGAAAALPLQPR